MRVGVTFGMLTDKKIETFWIIKILFCSSCQIKIYSYMIIYKNFDSLTPLIISSSYHKKPLLKWRYNTEWVRSLLPVHNQDTNKRSLVREQYGYTYHVTTVIITWHFSSIWIYVQRHAVILAKPMPPIYEIKWNQAISIKIYLTL